MTTNGGGWALFAYHEDDRSVVEVDVPTPSTFGVIGDTAWQALRDSSEVGMMFVDEFGAITFMDKSLFEASSCVVVSDADSLTDLPLSRHRYSLWHDESVGCDVQDTDYSFVFLDDENTSGAALDMRSGTAFTIWPYDGETSSTEQDELLYYIR